MGDDEDDFGCWFPDECCMPGLHMRSECHTAEMIEAFNAECEAMREPEGNSNAG
jgi:hypothetical protein